MRPYWKITAGIAVIVSAIMALATIQIKIAAQIDDCKIKGKLTKHDTVYESGICWVQLDKDTMLPWENAVDLMMFSWTAKEAKKSMMVADIADAARDQALLGPPKMKNSAPKGKR